MLQTQHVPLTFGDSGCYGSGHHGTFPISLSQVQGKHVTGRDYAPQEVPGCQGKHILRQDIKD